MMPRSKFSRFFMLTLAFVATACVRADRVTSIATAEASTGWTEQTQTPVTTVQSFTTVSGADLKARLDAASQQAWAKGGDPRNLSCVSRPLVETVLACVDRRCGAWQLTPTATPR